MPVFLEYSLNLPLSETVITSAEEVVFGFIHLSVCFSVFIITIMKGSFCNCLFSYGLTKGKSDNNFGKDLIISWLHKIPEFSKLRFSVYFNDLCFLVDITREVIMNLHEIVDVGRVWPTSDYIVITYWKDLHHILDTKNSWIFGNIPWWRSVPNECFLVIHEITCYTTELPVYDKAEPWQMGQAETST